MSSILKANPRGINELFFSGSQTIEKGEEIEWILDETFAFKVTEKCLVSTNASPFVQVYPGDTFIIYKRTQKDRKEGNTKGIYVFDRDTVLGLAYPQEIVQDIIIENDIYNTVQNTVIVESDKTPTAKIEIGSQAPQAGQRVTISFASSYAISPAKITRYQLSMNGKIVHNSTASSYSFTPPRSGLYDLTLVVTDNQGKKGDTSSTMRVKDKAAAIGDYTQSVSQEVTNNAPHQKLKYATLSVDKSVSGHVGITASVSLLIQYSAAMKDKSPALPTLYLYVDNVLKGVQKVPVQNTNQRITYSIQVGYNGSISKNQKITLYFQDENSTVNYRANHALAQSPANIQLKVSNRSK